MNFVKYNSIDNVTNKEVEKFMSSSLYNPKDQWVVTEKIDGSNFAIYFDNNGDIIPAKRSSLITIDSSFYNFQRIINKYGNGFKNIYGMLLNGHIKLNSISIHGELCGGLYSNTENLQTKAVQKRVMYSNDIEFAVFDIRLFYDDDTWIYLSYDKVVEICQQYKVPVLPIIYQGTFTEVLIWAHEHNADPSEVWKLFNMENEVDGNIREGNVIKPLNCDLFNNESRIIFKDKNEKFDEKEQKGSKVKKIVTFNPEKENIIEIAKTYITINRFHSVTSKFGEYSIKNFGELLIQFVDDVIDEMIRDDVIDDIENDVRKRISSMVSSFFVDNKKELF